MENQWRAKETLHLTLKQPWFDLMISGVKTFEVRKPSDWLMARIYKTAYETVTFRNGYSKSAPTFVAEYHGYMIAKKYEKVGFGITKLEIHPGDVVIFLGKVINQSNYE